MTTDHELGGADGTLGTYRKIVAWGAVRIYTGCKDSDLASATLDVWKPICAERLAAMERRD